MEQKLSSSNQRGDLSSSNSDSDPEREFSGDDDDDRNHKHRRREIRPQSSEFDAPQSVSSKPFNKRNKPFQNGNSFRGNGSRVNGGWKSNSFTPSDSELLKPDRRHFDMPMFSRPQMDMNQRIGLGQTYFGDSGFARGRGRDSWTAHAPRFGSMEFSQAANHGSVSSNLYAGRGLSNVAGVHTAAWNPYPLLPAIPNGGIDTVHSIGISSSLRPSINPPSSTGIIRQKCRDFEERGFCLRGDMCPMEHGVNRIVVDDVQSLSKFNLPVSIPGGNGLGVGGGSGPLPTGTGCASFLANNTKIHRKMVKSKTARKGTNSDAVGAFSNSAAAAGNDFYDPDQPLWNKNGPESSTALSQPCSPENQQDPALVGDPSCENPDEIQNVSGIYPLSGSACSGADSHKLAQSSLGSLHGTGSKSELKGKVSEIPNFPGHDNYIQDKEDALKKNQTTSAQGVSVFSENKNTNVMDASQRRLKGSSRNSQKPPQKAMRTIFVNGIPQKDNNIEALRSHFQKFGEIIDIYIPSNGEKAFVQFSTREEAEAALKAPDAVMGNRFIKLWWANRDSIPDTGISGGNNPFMNPLVGTAYPGPAPLSIRGKGRSNQLPALKANATLSPASIPKVNAVTSTHITVSDQGKHVISTGPLAVAPSQKKLDSLEVLKEELRKKQELLDQKRNEFKRQLDKLEKQKQATGVKSEPPSGSEQPAKRQKVVMNADVANRIAPQSAAISTSVNLPQEVEGAEKVKRADKPLVQDPNTGSTLLSQPTTSQNVINISSAKAENVPVSRSKVGNQPRSFKIVPPLPSDLANIVTMREHFSLYGKVDDVELVNADTDECRTAIISFDTPLSADKAFHSAKSLKGHDLQFTWVTEDIREGDNTSSSANEPMDVDAASQNNVLQKESAPQPDEDSKATEKDITDKVALPVEKPTPCEELVEGIDEEKACHSQPGDIVKQEEQLSDERYAEETDGKKSYNEDSVKTLDEQDYEEDAEREHDNQLSDDDCRRSYEEHPSHIHVDYMNDEHFIEEVEEETLEREDQPSEDDVM